MLQPVNFESLTVNSASAVSLTAAKLIRDNASPPIAIEVQVLGAPINVRADGTAPTTALGGGTRYEPTSVFRITTQPGLRNFQAILAADAAMNATINVHYMV